MALKAAAGELDPAASPTLAALAQLAAEFPPLAEPGAAQPAAQQVAAGTEAGDEAEEAARPSSGGAPAPAGKASAAAATKAALLGGTPFHPHMLSEVVNAFRPLGGSSAPVSANVVLGPGSGKPNGSLPLAVSRAGLPGRGLLPANLGAAADAYVLAACLCFVKHGALLGFCHPLSSAAVAPAARSVPYSSSFCSLSCFAAGVHPFFCGCSPPRAVQPRWEQEDAHDFLEYLVDRMHQELLVLARADTGEGALPPGHRVSGSSRARVEGYAAMCMPPMPAW